jgi:hypothetical protein
VGLTNPSTDMDNGTQFAHLVTHDKYFSHISLYLRLCVVYFGQYAFQGLLSIHQMFCFTPATFLVVSLVVSLHGMISEKENFVQPALDYMLNWCI